MHVDHYDKGHLRRLEAVRAPILQHLLLHLNHWGRSGTLVLDPFRDHPPELTSLTLVEVTMRRWDSTIFGPRLHKLNLARIFTSGPTREDLRVVFRSCPNLAHLGLERVTLSDEANRFLPQGPPVQLLLLHTLVLDLCSPVDAIDIAKIAGTPRCRSYTISIDSEDPNSTTFSVVALQAQKQFQASISSSRSLDMHLDNFWIHMICRSGQSPSSDFNLKLNNGGSCEQMLNWLNSMLHIRPPPLIPIDLHLDYKYYGGSLPSPSNLFQLSSVQSLTITDGHGVIMPLIEALSIPGDLGGGSDKWMWPSLREVTIWRFSSPSTTLLHMIKARKEAALGKEETGNGDGIVMLGMLVVGEDVFTVEEFEAFRAVLGDVAGMVSVKRCK
ncbi:hypothetical protein FRB94_010821 [Tulasnella sp. JGI-2019a]|nr:hypothetical protein FRB94_010821 [Tulasnella sp. JGI-2019a]